MKLCIDLTDSQKKRFFYVEMSNRPDHWERINSGLYKINMVDEDDA